MSHSSANAIIVLGVRRKEQGGRGRIWGSVRPHISLSHRLPPSPCFLANSMNHLGMIWMKCSPLRLGKLARK